MAKEKDEKIVIGGVVTLIAFVIYIFGVVHSASHYSKNKALTAFLIPPYGFYMGIKGFFGSNPETQFLSTNSTNTEKYEIKSPLTQRELMEKSIEVMNQGLPRTEGLYRLDKVNVVNDYTYGYHGTLLNVPTYTNEFESQALELKLSAVNKICTDPQGQIAAKSGTHAIFYSYALDGSFLFSVEITPQDCGY
ncbi:hypothetical protein [Acinetobacter baumannii]|uniref:hypothetical protein n=1 Tax=Acinetobacter baumannii TaxID=470 RepID=UPI0034DDCD6D